MEKLWLLNANMQRFEKCCNGTVHGTGLAQINTSKTTSYDYTSERWLLEPHSKKELTFKIQTFASLCQTQRSCEFAPCRIKIRKNITASLTSWSHYVSLTSIWQLMRAGPPTAPLFRTGKQRSKLLEPWESLNVLSLIRPWHDTQFVFSPAKFCSHHHAQ